VRRQFLITLSCAAAFWTVATEARSQTCALSELPGLSAQYARAARVDVMLAPAGAADFWIVAASVVRWRGGSARQPGDRFAVDGVGLPSLDALPCDSAVVSRDRLAWSMGMVGYSAREIADVIDGHLTRAVLDQAYARAMAGEPRDKVAAFLESKWRDVARDSARRSVTLPRCTSTATASHTVIDELAAEIARLAEEHRVAPAVIRAVIAAESNGNPCAVSRAGAIGLMQLMPATAVALGVDPWNPLENLRGGVTYLASMLRAYDEDLRLALIAYNAGPQHADRVRAGRAVAYRETRRYLEAVLTFLSQVRSTG
jgi:soluble lytic murein transglycosylase-like protein